MVPCYFGIDPGKHGAIALIDQEGAVVQSCPLTISGEYDIQEMINLIRGWTLGQNTVLGIENVHAMPFQGVVSMFTMGYGLGLWHGILRAEGIVPIIVQPKEWREYHNVTVKVPRGSTKKIKEAAKKYRKELSLSTARALYPKSDIKTVDQAEAILIALYVKHKTSR